MSTFGNQRFESMGNVWVAMESGSDGPRRLARHRWAAASGALARLHVLYDEDIYSVDPLRRCRHEVKGLSTATTRAAAGSLAGTRLLC